MEEGKVKMYVCGPTVYDFIHIGNARPYIVVFSLFARLMILSSTSVKFCTYVTS